MPRRRPDEEQKALYELWRRSGLTGTEFCKQNHISTNSLWRWRKKFGMEVIKDDPNKPITKDLKFYPVDAIGANNCKNSFLEIALPKGINCKVYLPESSINAFLKELLK